jgi:uncharacterized protein (TIGR03382 family)
MLMSLSLLVGLLHGPVPVYRSVGSNPGPLATGQGMVSLTINATVATFEQRLPDNVGVGDVIQYDSNGDGTPDVLAFIIQRYSGASFEVRDRRTFTPPPATTHAWSVFRAYPTLAAALNTADRPGLVTGGTENPAIDPALVDFDTFDGGMDLVDAGNVLNVACYNDGDVPDDTLVWVGPPWVTDAQHRINIFTPVNAGEVGISQRHHGTWGSGYRRTQGLHIVDRDVTVDGLSIQQDRALGPPNDSQFDNRVLLVHTGHKGSDIRISNCYGEQARTDNAAWGRVFDFYDDDFPFGMSTTQALLWNSIGVTRSSMVTTPIDGSAAIMANTSDSLFVANCTAIAPNGATAILAGNDHGASTAATLLNTIAVSIDGGSLTLIQAAPPFIANHVSSIDTSVTTAAMTASGGMNFPGNMVTFVGPADFHLAASDTGAVARALALTSDPHFTFTDDIDGQPRQGSWDLGADQRYTPSPPAVTTQPAGVHGPDTATLVGQALPNFSAAHGWFRYGPGAVSACDDAFGQRAPPASSIAVGQNDLTPVTYAQTVTGLMPLTTYSFCAIAENDAGLGFGMLLMFTTPGDGGVMPDGGAPDAGAPDAGLRDGGAADAGPVSPQTDRVSCGCGQADGPLALPLVLLAVQRLRHRRRAARAAAAR